MKVLIDYILLLFFIFLSSFETITTKVFIAGPDALIKKFIVMKNDNELVVSFTNFGNIPYGSTIVTKFIILFIDGST